MAPPGFSVAKESVSVLIKTANHDEVSVGLVVSTDEVSVKSSRS